MPIKLRGFQKIYNKIIQRELKMVMIKKYLKKDMYLKKKDKKLLMNWHWNNSIIMQYQKIINLIVNKIAEAVAESYNGRITKVSKNWRHDNSEKVTKENNNEIPKERNVHPAEKLKILDNFDLNIIA